MYTELTQGIEVVVTPEFLPEHSRPDVPYYFFAYHVRITNRGEKPVQLISRHWIIRDGMGRNDEVRGPGVVGLQPILEIGQSFEYSSSCPLPTPTGSMRGAYQMVDAEGARFEAKIPLFFLRDMNRNAS